MRTMTRVVGVFAAAAIPLTAGLAPASADTVNSSVTGGTLSETTSAPTTMSAVTLDGTSTQTSTGTSGAWSITDARGTGAAWALSVSATAPTSAAGTTETTARTIPVSDFTITPGTVTAGTGADAAGTIVAPALKLSTTSQALVSTPGGTSPNKGTYSLTPTFDLAFPANAYRSNYAVGTTGTLNAYTSTLTYTIA